MVRHDGKRHTAATRPRHRHEGVIQAGFDQTVPQNILDALRRLDGTAV
jgi:hypothetical protein